MDCKNVHIKNRDIEHMLETDSDSEASSNGEASSNESDPLEKISVSLKKKRLKKTLPKKKDSKSNIPSGKEAKTKIKISTRANKKVLLDESDTIGNEQNMRLGNKKRPEQNLKAEFGLDQEDDESELPQRIRNVLSRIFTKSSAIKRKPQNDDDNQIKRPKIEENPPSIKLRLKVDTARGGRSSWKLSNSSSPLTKGQEPDGSTCEGSKTPTKQSARKNLFLPEDIIKATSCEQSSSFTRTPNKKRNIDDSSSNKNRRESPSKQKESTPKKNLRNEIATNKALKNKTPSKQIEDDQDLNSIPIELSNENLVHESFSKKKNLLHLTPQKHTRRASKQTLDDDNDNFSCDEIKETIPSNVKNRTPLKEIASSPLRYSSRRTDSKAIQEDSPSKVITALSNATLSATPRRLQSTNISKSNSEDCIPELSDNNTTPRKELNTAHLTPQKLKYNAQNSSPQILLSRISSNENNFKNKTPLKTIQESPKNEVSSPKDTTSSVDLETFTPVKNITSQVGKTNLSSSKRCVDALKVKGITSPLKNQEITVTTPVSKKKEGRGFLTPSMAKRSNEATDSTDNALDVTRKQLHISTVPKYLPCRDTEFSQIKSFLLRKIEHSTGGCMYISGVPGTGKTATVHAVIRALQEDVSQGDLEEFDFVEVNGLRLTEPRQAYVRIYQALTNQKLTPDQAQQLLNKRFSSNCKKSTIILVDELDYLCNRRQDVVYNILDWPSKRSSALVVLTISNTMDLPERTLKGRVTSRMGLTRLTFQPYTHHQLKEIVLDRLSGSTTFHPDAVQLVARKVAAVSGDARRALDVCRRTTELIRHKEEQIKVSHVEEALVQLCASARVQVIRALSGLGQIVLRSVRDVCQRTGVDETTASSVYQHLRQLTLLEGIPVPSPGALLETCVALVRLGLLVAEKGRVDLTRKMSLNVSSDDIHFALDNIRS